MSKEADDRLEAALDRLFTPKGYGFDTTDVMCASHNDADLEAAIRGVVHRQMREIGSHSLRPQLRRLAKERHWDTIDGCWVIRASER